MIVTAHGHANEGGRGRGSVQHRSKLANVILLIYFTVSILNPLKFAPHHPYFFSLLLFLYCMRMFSYVIGNMYRIVTHTRLKTRACCSAFSIQPTFCLNIFHCMIWVYFRICNRCSRIYILLQDLCNWNQPLLPNSRKYCLDKSLNIFLENAAINSINQLKMLCYRVDAPFCADTTATHTTAIK